MKVTCLLVDDLEENLLVLQALLCRDDVELLTARSGVEALDLLLVHDVALALVDVQMPDMDGFELAELMRGSERTRHIPLIFVTAGARDQRRVFKGYDTGAVDFLYKPIEPAILRNKAEVFFQLHRQKRQLEQELIERTETLRLNEMFAAVLGHDLRSPLGAMMTAAHLLPLLTPEPRVHDVATRLLSSGAQMTRMIEDLLDMTRARLGGGIPISVRETELGPLVLRAIQEKEAAWPDRHISVQMSGDTHGTWDPDRILQVVSNLLGNALEHGTPGSPVATLVNGSDPGIVVLDVVNQGTIPPEVFAHIFDPFRSGRQGTTRSGGLGLGLFIAKQIVEAHHGRIHASCDEVSTTLQVTLPRGE
jgi:two-component system sensor histidine kinase/response regulator